MKKKLTAPLGRIHEIYRGGKISKDRLVGLSDGFIAIIITLMVLEIPVPKSMSNTAEIATFGLSILIYFASFIVVGLQWNRHHHILERVEKVSNSFIWKNMIYLFSLSLIPLLMKWIISFPGEILPAFCYALSYIFNDFCLRWIYLSSREDGSGLFHNLHKSYGRRRQALRMLLTFIWIVLILVISVIAPQVEIFFLIILPVMISLQNLFEKE
ncbi:MAG: TMEM175 family protein [bacterium]|nr:TMEM175 family protein [bacterium]